VKKIIAMLCASILAVSCICFSSEAFAEECQPSQDFRTMVETNDSGADFFVEYFGAEFGIADWQNVQYLSNLPFIYRKEYPTGEPFSLGCLCTFKWQESDRHCEMMSALMLRMDPKHFGKIDEFNAEYSVYFFRLDQVGQKKTSEYKIKGRIICGSGRGDKILIAPISPKERVKLFSKFPVAWGKDKKSLLGIKIIKEAKGKKPVYYNFPQTVFDYDQRGKCLISETPPLRYELNMMFIDPNILPATEKKKETFLFPEVNYIGSFDREQTITLKAQFKIGDWKNEEFNEVGQGSLDIGTIQDGEIKNMAIEKEAIINLIRKTDPGFSWQTSQYTVFWNVEAITSSGKCENPESYISAQSVFDKDPGK